MDFFNVDLKKLIDYFYVNIFKDYEFVMYMDLPECLQNNNGVLKIKPILSEDHFGSGFVVSPKGYDFKDKLV